MFSHLYRTNNNNARFILAMTSVNSHVSRDRQIPAVDAAGERHAACRLISHFNEVKLRGKLVALMAPLSNFSWAN